MKPKPSDGSAGATGFDAFASRTGTSSRRTGGYPCLTCSLPSELRAEIVALRSRPEPVSFYAISAYLATDHGINIGSSTLGSHFRKGHEKDGSK